MSAAGPLGSPITTASLAVVVLVSVALFAVAWIVHALHARCRRLDLEIRACREREARREEYCGIFGHHLDPACICTRCLTSRHDYALPETRREPIRCELINPRADPGALYLDSNFQPDPDYGKTQTVFRVERTYRCSRCAHETVTVAEEAVDDEV